MQSSATDADGLGKTVMLLEWLATDGIDHQVWSQASNIQFHSHHLFHRFDGVRLILVWWSDDESIDDKLFAIGSGKADIAAGEMSFGIIK